MLLFIKTYIEYFAHVQLVEESLEVELPDELDMFDTIITHKDP